MKKNILAVVILAATLVNLTLSGVMLFVYLPNAQKMNTLIMKVCETIDMELQEPLPVTRTPKPTAADLQGYLVGEDMMISLSKKGNEKNYYGMITATLMLNTKADDYEAIAKVLDAQADRVKEIFYVEIGKLTQENFISDRDAVKERILTLLQDEFNTDCIYRIDYGKYIVGQ